MVELTQLVFGEPRCPTRSGASLLESRTQDGASSYVDSYHETIAYVDGLGRTVDARHRGATAMLSHGSLAMPVAKRTTT